MARHIIATREKFRSWFGGEPPTAADSNRQPSTAADSMAVDSSRQLTKNARELAGIRFANAMLILIGRSLNMLGKLMAQHGEEFRQEAASASV